ncbi:histidine kinase [Mycolicibacterium moriokaense]|uniref:GAF domain-containing protein n=1 Tax=Mycolicibacterium moriokaense TaxID=39691 RepID=A0AAD1HF62_9MYCO|nr:GAF domain-containing protein [Mycolicibacterium moriokaense]MCV7038899.1 GAF domain-containing protein [Mycolicibacterium moriokaense]ORB25527.1 histidine kinase [Mycolicibacterium moriokaense]BBX03489.1 hypothetical protein MMOR_44250 [Mycolicibacterium moriokaense]
MTHTLPEFDDWLENALVEEADMAGESVDTYIARAVAARMVIGRARRGEVDIQELLAHVRAAHLDLPGPISGDAVLSDPDRLRALYDSGFLNAERAHSLDRVVAMVVAALGVPSAAVSLVDRDTQYMCSAIGLKGEVARTRQGPSEGSLGREIVASGKPLILEDVRKDPHLIDHFAVRNGYIVAYAGFPLKDGHGHTIGTLAAWNTRPRRWSSGHIQLMEDFVMMIRARIFGIAPE